MSERPSLETRLARRANRDFAAGATMRRRAARHAGEGRMVARMTARGAERVSRHARYTQRSASGDFLISRLSARTGEGRAMRAPLGSTMGAWDDGFVAATPPWLARQEAAEEAIPQIRRRFSQPTPSVPAANIFPVASSAPIARAARLARSSGVAPPSMSLASLRAPAPLSGPTAEAPLSFGAPSGFISREPSTPFASPSFSSVRPLSRTAAAVWSTPAAAPARRRAQRPGTRALARMDAGLSTAAPTIGARGPLRTASVLARAQAPTLGRGFSVARSVAGSLRRSGLAYPDLEHLVAPSFEAPEPLEVAPTVEAEPWVHVARSEAPAAAPPSAPYVAPRSTALIARAGASAVPSSAVVARQAARSAARAGAAGAARGLARYASTPASAPVAAAVDRGTLRRSRTLAARASAPASSATFASPSYASSATSATPSYAAFADAPTGVARRAARSSSPISRAAARGLGLRGPDAVQRAVAPHAARRRAAMGATAALALAAPAPTGFAAPALTEAPEAAIQRSARPLTGGPSTVAAPLARYVAPTSPAVASSAARATAVARSAHRGAATASPTYAPHAGALTASARRSRHTGAPTATARSTGWSGAPTAVARALASDASLPVAGGSVGRAARRSVASRWTEPTPSVARSAGRALPGSAAAHRAAPASTARFARTRSFGAGPELALPDAPFFAPEASEAPEAAPVDAPSPWVEVPRSEAAGAYVPPSSTAVTARAVSRSVSPASRALARSQAPTSTALTASAAGSAPAASAPTARILQRAARSSARTAPSVVARSHTAAAGTGLARVRRLRVPAAPDAVLAPPHASRTTEAAAETAEPTSRRGTRTGAVASDPRAGAVASAPASPVQRMLSRAALPLAAAAGTPVDPSGVVGRSRERLSARASERARPLTGGPSLELPSAAFGFATQAEAPAAEASVAAPARRLPGSTAAVARATSTPHVGAPAARSSATAPRSTSSVSRALARSQATAAAVGGLPLRRGTGFRKAAAPVGLELPVGFGPVGAFDRPTREEAAPAASPSPWVTARAADSATASAATAAWSTRATPGATTASPSYRASAGAPTALQRAATARRSAAGGMPLPHLPTASAPKASASRRPDERAAQGPRGLSRVLARSHEIEKETRLGGGELTYAGAPRAMARGTSTEASAPVAASSRTAMRRGGTRAYRRPGTSRTTLARIATAQGNQGVPESSAETATLADAGGMVHRAAEEQARRREPAPLRRSRVHRTSTADAGNLDTPDLRAMVKRQLAELTTVSAQAPGFSAEAIAREAQQQLKRQETPVTSGGGREKGQDDAKADLDDFLLRIVRQIVRDETVWGERIFNPHD